MKKFLLILLIIAVAALGYLSTQGLFTSIDVQQGEQGGYILIGKHHMGPYYTIGEVFAELAEQAPGEHFMGVYLDDPEAVPEDSCRSFAGWQVASAAEALAYVADHPGYNIFEIKRKRAVYCDWPHAQGLGILMGTMKAYPALGAAALATEEYTPEAMLAFEDYGADQMRYVMQY